MTSLLSSDRLVIDKVAVHFGGLVAISDMSFAVEPGTIVSLIGPNGAGKTTAFNVVTGFMRPSAGHVRYKGWDLTALTPAEVAELGVIRTFQRTSVFNECTVFDGVLTSLHLRGSAGFFRAVFRSRETVSEESRLREEAVEILKFVGLENRSHVLAKFLSYGEQRHLALAMALAAQPTMLLLDEPAAGLNPYETRKFMDLIYAIRERGITILLVEHDMHLVMSISDCVYVLNNGRIIASGAPKEVQNNPEVIRAYLGQGFGHAEH